MMRDEKWRHVRTRMVFDAAAMLIAAILSAGSQVQGASPRGQSELLGEIEHAVTLSPEIGAPRAAEAYNLLFSGMSENDLQATAKSGPMGIALHALWQLRGRASRARFDPASRLSVIRYLEEEAHLHVPAAWAARFELSFHSGDQTELNRVLEYYYQRGTAPVDLAPEGLRDVGVRFILKSPTTRRRTDVGFSVDEGTRASLSGTSLLITQGENSVSCDARVLPVRNEDPASSSHCTAVVGARLSFLTFSDDDAGPYLLYCIDTKTGSVRWRTRVWGAYPTGAPYFPSGPPIRHNVYLSAGERFVGVFGSALQLYTEVFRADSGQVAARFSTHLWASAGSIREESKHEPAR